MSNQNLNQREDQIDDTLDLDIELERRMNKYYAPGGLYEAQQRRVPNNSAVQKLPAIELYVWVNSLKSIFNSQVSSWLSGTNDPLSTLIHYLT